LRANIISWDSGGLATDTDVLTAALVKFGYDVRFAGRKHRWPRSRAHSRLMTAGVLAAQTWATLTRRPLFDVNLFLESVFPEYLPSARVNFLFANQEWFRDFNLPHLPRLNLILCKSPKGVEAFRGLPVECRNVDFTSPDRRIAGFVRNGPLRCLHLSGKSAFKGTDAVIEAWSRHPEWPELIVVRRAGSYGGGEALPMPAMPAMPNVRYLTDYVSSDQLRELQNACEVHVSPSQAEGYGHVIGEAMGCGGVVVTTDAPPMNELITPDRGVLIRVARSEPMSRSVRNFVDVADLETKLQQVFGMSTENRARLGRNARAWFEAQHIRFEAAMQSLLAALPNHSMHPSRTPR
jgi:glycosyltransferase involved in cell wall biosynthesis